MQVWEKRAHSAVQGSGVICQVTAAAWRNRVGGTRSAQLIRLALGAGAPLAPEAPKTEEVRGLLPL